MSEFFWDTITEDMKFVLNGFSQSEIGKQYSHAPHGRIFTISNLYFICQRISLRELLGLAPQKYPSVRDFETHVVKRLVFFETADVETDPPLLQPVSWEEVKNHFIARAKEIGQSWLE